MVGDAKLQRDLIEHIGLQPVSGISEYELTAPAVRRLSAANTPDGFFEDIPLSKPDPILRPMGDTTHFTSAGIQHIETRLRQHGDLSAGCFRINQPCIRSQYAGDIEEGFSSSFINAAVVTLDSSTCHFAESINGTLVMLRNEGADISRLRFRFNSCNDTWGERSFQKTFFDFLMNGHEIAEGVFIHKYPVSDTKAIDVSEVCWGQERKAYLLGARSHYFDLHKGHYPPEKERRLVTQAIDCLHTLTLVTAAGVLPAHSNPGRVSRLLAKKFAVLNQELLLNPTPIIETSFMQWKDAGAKPVVPLPETISVIIAEVDRSRNGLLLQKARSTGHKLKNLDVNQPTEAFAQELHRLVPDSYKDTGVSAPVIPQLNIQRSHDKLDLS